MVKHELPTDATTLDETFQALSDPTRRSILARLMGGSARVTDVASNFDMSLPAVSKHIRVLEAAGLIDRRIEGRAHHLSLNVEPLTAAYDWVGHYVRFWSDSLVGLEAFLDRGHAETEEASPRRRDPSE